MQRNLPLHSPFASLLILVWLAPIHATAIIKEEFFQAAMIDDRVHGQLTTSGIRYHRDDMVATHPYLPFGTMIEIIHLRNGKSVVAKVIARPQPIYHNIGLSTAAASQLEILPNQAVEVSITIQMEKPLIAAPPTAESTIPVAWRPAPASSTPPQVRPQINPFRLQFGSFTDPTNAGILQRSLSGLGIPAEVHPTLDQRLFRVLSRATYASGNQAEEVATLLKQRGLVREAMPVR